jgi:hypothetical protein
MLKCPVGSGLPWWASVHSSGLLTLHQEITRRPLFTLMLLDLHGLSFQDQTHWEDMAADLARVILFLSSPEMCSHRCTKNDHQLHLIPHLPVYHPFRGLCRVQDGPCLEHRHPYLSISSHTLWHRKYIVLPRKFWVASSALSLSSNRSFMLPLSTGECFLVVSFLRNTSLGTQDS